MLNKLAQGPLLLCFCDRALLIQKIEVRHHLVQLGEQSLDVSAFSLGYVNVNLGFRNRGSIFYRLKFTHAGHYISKSKYWTSYYRDTHRERDVHCHFNSTLYNTLDEMKGIECLLVKSFCCCNMLLHRDIILAICFRINPSCRRLVYEQS